MTNPRFEDRRDTASSYKGSREKWPNDRSWSIVIAAVAALLLVGGILVYVAANPKTVMLSSDPTTGQGIPGPFTPAPPGPSKI